MTIPPPEPVGDSVSFLNNDVGEEVTATSTVRRFENIQTATQTVAETTIVKAGVRHIALLAIFSHFVIIVARIGSWWAAFGGWSLTTEASGMLTT